MSHSHDVTLVPNTGWDERILVCRNAPLVDTFIVLTQRYVVLVDTMINPVTAEKLLAYAQPHVQNGRSLLVINTHADYDHCWGNQVFAAYGVPIIGSRLSAAQFHNPDTANLLAQMQAAEPDIFNQVRLTPPTLQFDERLVIDGGDLSLELFLTPGHTIDHASLYLPEINTLLAGDAAELPYPMARTPEGVLPMCRSLQQLVTLNAQTVLYCHAPVTIGPRLLAGNLAYFRAVETAVRTALAQGISPHQPEEADLAALTGCTFADAFPADLPQDEIHPYYRHQGHQKQLRDMLTAVA